MHKFTYYLATHNMYRDTLACITLKHNSEIPNKLIKIIRLKKYFTKFSPIFFFLNLNIIFFTI